MVTIKDVARSAGVSAATVSRVLNASGPVSPAARRRVRAAAKQLGYVPNGAAQSLSRSRTTALGVLLPALYGEFFSEIMRGIDGAARRGGYHLLLAGAGAGSRELQASLQSLRGRVDGLIVMAPDAPGHAVFSSLADDFPAVLISSAGTDRFSSVGIDNAGGAHAMVRHLLSLGHRRIAMIAGPPDNHDAAERRRGYHAALLEAGRVPEPATVLAGNFSEASGHRAVAALLRLRPRPTALFAANDSMAIGAISALHERGLVVPDDMAVVGFDDLSVARYTNPPLTTVSVDIAALGQRATQRVLEIVRSGARSGAPVREIVPTQLVVRQSCGATGARTPLHVSPPSKRRAASALPSRRSSV